MQQSIGQDQLGQQVHQQQQAQQVQQQQQQHQQMVMSQQVQMSPQVQMAPQVQMMYSPVRLVYDPGMMMQQEQIQQQNQNMFVNQPPWARPVQNQVIYVQQIGQNLVPIQQIDPNIYIQQNPYTGVPQMVQNIQNLPQGQIRSIMQSIPQHMVQNFVPNIQALTTEQPMGQIMANYGFIQANPEVNVVNNAANVNATNSEESRQVVAQNVTQNVPTQEAQTQIYRPVMQQINQQQTLIRPQMQILNQLQNMTNMQNIAHQAGMVGQMIQNNAQTAQNAPGNAQISQNVSNVGHINQNTATNFGQINHNTVGNVSQNVSQNIVQAVQNTVSNVGQNLVSNVRHIAPNPTTNVNQMANTNIRPSIGMNIAQNQQNIAVNRPNIDTNTQTNMGQMMPQIRQITQTQQVNIMPRNIPQSYVNTSTVDRNVNVNTVMYSAVRNGQPYTYRAIQPKPRMNYVPRPNQVSIARKPLPQNMNVNMKVDNSTSMPTNVPNQIRPNFVTAPPIAIKTEPDNNTFNRKRKSESPDEVQKKVANFGSITVTEQVKDRIKAKYGHTTNEIGINTSPVRKIEPKVENQQPMLQINPMEARIKTELVKTPEIVSKPTNITTNNDNTQSSDGLMQIKVKKELKDMGQQTETQPFVRKTVFPQAKGRLLENKANNVKVPENVITNVPIPNVPQTIEPPKTMAAPKPVNTEPIKPISKVPTNVNQNNTSAVLAEIKNLEEIKAKMTAEQTNKPMQIKNEMKPLIEPKPAIPIEVKRTDDLVKEKEPEKILPPREPEIVKKEITPAPISDRKSEEKAVIPDKTVSKPENPCPKPVDDEKMDTTESVSKLPTDFDEIIKDNKIEKVEYKNISISEIAGKEIHIIDGNITKKERDFVLTHVLDGYVIQESNVPFAIRKPLREKTINAAIDEKQESMRNMQKTEARDKLLELSQLHIEETKETEGNESVEQKKKEGEENKTELKIEDCSQTISIEKENPFRELKHSVVKTWTVDELTSYLSKHNWTETVSLLQEHEIDGESLFLVTKTQLITIGVSDDHADIICEFLENK